jgi:hypothetical protein
LLAEKKRKAKAQRKTIVSSINVVFCSTYYYQVFPLNFQHQLNRNQQCPSSTITICSKEKLPCREFNKTDPKPKAIQKEIIYKNTNKNLKTTKTDF